MAFEKRHTRVLCGPEDLSPLLAGIRDREGEREVLLQ